MEIKIDKNVAIPAKDNRGGARAIVRGMAVGDSFFVTSKPGAASAILRNVGFKASQRKVTENGVTGFRIWRTA